MGKPDMIGYDALGKAYRDEILRYVGTDASHEDVESVFRATAPPASDDTPGVVGGRAPAGPVMAGAPGP